MHTFPLGVHKLTTSAYSPSGDGGVERVYHTMAKILAIGLQRTPKMIGMHTFSFGIHKFTASAYSPSGDGGVERIYYTTVMVPI